MGNISAKERTSSPPNPSSHSRNASSSSRHRGGSTQERSSSSFLGGSSRRDRETSNRNLNLEPPIFGLGFPGTQSRAERSLSRREDEREAREARKAEKEREKEADRQRSLREESLDGGFLVTQGVYTGPQDFKEKIVRHLMIERKLAPFWKGLPDHEENWTDAQLYAAFHGLPIPPPDAEVPPDISEFPSAIQNMPSNNASESNLNLTVPIATRSRSQSYTSDSSGRSGGISVNSSRTRSKTLTISSPLNPVQLTSATNPLETNIPGRTVDGRPIEAVLYKVAKECPICFLYYPPWQNKTRCCDQEICSECFVQIKRADPHLPHDNPDEGTLANADLLISEPACCPFCKEPDFGVVYTPPPFRRGLIYTDSIFAADLAALGTASPTFGTPGSSIPHSPTSPSSPPTGSVRRRTAYASTAPEVVAIDMIRPDWAHKLAAARSQASRRAAAATALHTAAFLLSNSTLSGPGGSGSSGSVFTSRRLIRRSMMNSQGSESQSPSPGNSGSGTPNRSNSNGHGNGVMGSSYGGFGIGTLSERNASPVSGGRPGDSVSVGMATAGLSLLGVPSGRDRDREEPSSRRRSRLIDLEEMMLREAIRLSLVEEEERKRKEDKETTKREKEEKEEKEKASHRKSFFGSFSGNSSSTALDTGEGSSSSAGKGKNVDRSGSAGLGESSTKAYPVASGSSSLHNHSDNSKDSLKECTINFTSLADMVEDIDKPPATASALELAPSVTIVTGAAPTPLNDQPGPEEDKVVKARITIENIEGQATL